MNIANLANLLDNLKKWPNIPECIQTSIKIIVEEMILTKNEMINLMTKMDNFKSEYYSTSMKNNDRFDIKIQNMENSITTTKNTLVHSVKSLKESTEAKIKEFNAKHGYLEFKIIPTVLEMYNRTTIEQIQDIVDRRISSVKSDLVNAINSRSNDIPNIVKQELKTSLSKFTILKNEMYENNLDNFFNIIEEKIREHDVRLNDDTKILKMIDTANISIENMETKIRVDIESVNREIKRLENTLEYQTKQLIRPHEDKVINITNKFNEISSKFYNLTNEVNSSIKTAMESSQTLKDEYLESFDTVQNHLTSLQEEFNVSENSNYENFKKINSSLMESFTNIKSVVSTMHAAMSKTDSNQQKAIEKLNIKLKENMDDLLTMEMVLEESLKEKSKINPYSKNHKTDKLLENLGKVKGKKEIPIPKEEEKEEESVLMKEESEVNIEMEFNAAELTQPDKKKMFHNDNLNKLYENIKITDEIIKAEAEIQQSKAKVNIEDLHLDQIDGYSDLKTEIMNIYMSNWENIQQFNDYKKEMRKIIDDIKKTIDVLYETNIENELNTNKRFNDIDKEIKTNEKNFTEYSINVDFSINSLNDELKLLSQVVFNAKDGKGKSKNRYKSTKEDSADNQPTIELEEIYENIRNLSDKFDHINSQFKVLRTGYKLDNINLVNNTFPNNPIQNSYRNNNIDNFANDNLRMSTRQSNRTNAFKKILSPRDKSPDKDIAYDRFESPEFKNPNINLKKYNKKITNLKTEIINDDNYSGQEIVEKLNKIKPREIFNSSIDNQSKNNKQNPLNMTYSDQIYADMKNLLTDDNSKYGKKKLPILRKIE